MKRIPDSNKKKDCSEGQHRGKIWRSQRESREAQHCSAKRPRWPNSRRKETGVTRCRNRCTRKGTVNVHRNKQRQLRQARPNCESSADARGSPSRILQLSRGIEEKNSRDGEAREGGREETAGY